MHNKNLLSPTRLNIIINKSTKNKKERPTFIGGKPVVLLFLYAHDGNNDLEKIQMCTEKQVEYRVINSQIKFTHYSVIPCKDEIQQEEIFLSILMKYPILKTLQTKIIPSWKGTQAIKKFLGITKWDLNKIKQENDNASILYNGIQYWHTPTVEQMIGVSHD